jgi:hypothetical protein
VLGEVGEVQEDVGLPAQLVGDHGRLGADGGHHRHPEAAALQGLHQPPEVAVAGEQHHVVQVRGEVQRVHRHLDVHAALDPAAPGGVRELLGRLGHDGVAVVAEPIHEGAERRILVRFQRAV